MFLSFLHFVNCVRRASVGSSALKLAAFVGQRKEAVLGRKTSARPRAARLRPSCGHEPTKKYNGKPQEAATYINPKRKDNSRYIVSRKWKWL
jgi:hypothetical protein